MKQLILTFFAVILCYSLFFDNETKSPAIDEINYIYEDATPPMQLYLSLDTMKKYAYYQYPLDVQFLFNGYTTQPNGFVMIEK